MIDIKRISIHTRMNSCSGRTHVDFERGEIGRTYVPTTYSMIRLRCALTREKYDQTAWIAGAMHTRMTFWIRSKEELAELENYDPPF